MSDEIAIDEVILEWVEGEGLLRRMPGFQQRAYPLGERTLVWAGWAIRQWLCAEHVPSDTADRLVAELKERHPELFTMELDSPPPLASPPTWENAMRIMKWVGQPTQHQFASYWRDHPIEAGEWSHNLTLAVQALRSYLTGS